MKQMKQISIFIIVTLFSISTFAQQKEIKLSLNDKPVNLHSLSTGNTFDPVQKKTPKEKDFTFTFNPYLWTVAVGGSVSVETPEYESPGYYYFNMKFTDAVNYLKMAAMFAGRFKYKSVSLLYDVVYVKLSPVITVPVTSTGGYATISSEFKELISDVSLAYRFPTENKSIQVDGYGGVRVWSMDNTLNFTSTGGLLTSKNEARTWVDPILGAGINVDFEKKWFTYLKGDIGGFGAASEFTSAFLWGIGYKFNEQWNTSFGIKSLYVNFQRDKFSWKVWQTGLLLSVGFRL